MRDRSFRRFQEAKKKKWVQKTFSRIFVNGLDEKRIGSIAHTPKGCSCMACGNQRKYLGDTIAEKRIKNEDDWDVTDA